MQWVDIIEFDGASLTAKIVARARLEDGTAVLEGEEGITARLAQGVFSHEKGTETMPVDGLAFLHALGGEFRTPYLYATPVQDSGEPAPLGVATPIEMKKMS